MIRYYCWLLFLSLATTIPTLACELPVADFNIVKIDGRIVMLKNKSQNADSITWYGVNMDQDVYIDGTNLKLFPENNTAALDLGDQTDITAFTLCTASLPRTCNDIYKFMIVVENECGTDSLTLEVGFSTQTMSTNTVFGSAQMVHNTLNGYFDENNYDSVGYLSGYTFIAGRSSISILKPASHSQVEYLSDNYSGQNASVQNEMAYTYKPAKDFVGNDTAIVLVKTNYTYFDTVTIVITVEDAIANSPILPFEQTEITVQPIYRFNSEEQYSCFVGLTSKAGEFYIQSGGFHTYNNLLYYKGDSVFYMFTPNNDYVGIDKAIISATKNNITKTLSVTIKIADTIFKWAKAKGLPSVRINALYQFSSDTILVGTEGKGLYMSTDAGLNWEYNSLDGENISSIVRQGSTILIGTYLSDIYTANVWDSKWQWKNKPFPEHYIFEIKTNHDTVFIATAGKGFSGGLYYSADEGQNWHSVNDKVTSLTFDFGSNGRLFIGAPDQAYYTDDYINGKTVDYKTTSEINNGSFPFSCYYIETIGKDSVVFVGNMGTFLSIDNGKTVKSLQQMNSYQGFHKVSGKYFVSTGGELVYADKLTISNLKLRTTSLNEGISHIIRTKNSLIATNGTEIFVSSYTPSAPLSIDEYVKKPYSKTSKDGRLKIQVNGGTYPYTYKWSNTATSDDLQNIAIGEYTVTVTDAQGLSMTKSFTVGTQAGYTPLTCTATVRKATFYGAADGAVDLTVAGGTPPYTFKWNNSSTSEDLTRIQPGQYAVTVTDADGDSLAGAYSIDLLYAGTFSLSGTLYFDGSTFSPASVVLYSNVSGSYLPYLIAETNDTGTYSFSNLPAADYVLHAVPQDNEAVSPTYAYHSIRYSDALQLHLVGNTSRFNIDLQATVAHEAGSGEITGEVHSLYDAVVTNGIFATSATLKNATQEIDHVIVMVYSDGKQIAWDVTDSAGVYSIDGLPNGTYDVLVEIPGFGSNQQTVNITESMNSVSADFTIVEKAIVATSVSRNDTTEILFYPNPVSDILYLSINKAEIVQIFSISGEMIAEQRQCSELSVEHLMSGTYLLKVITSGTETTQLFIKE